MTLVHNPQLVQCLRCGAKIKLSLKSFWDPFHWHKHKERCLKKSDSVVQEMRESSDVSSGLVAIIDFTNLTDAVIQLPQPPAAPKPVYPTEAKVVSSKRGAPSPSMTPPLIPDEEDEDEDQSTAGPSRSPEVFISSRPLRPLSPPPPATYTAPVPQDAFGPEDYLFHPRPHHSHPDHESTTSRRAVPWTTLSHKPYYAPEPCDDQRCWSPPLSNLRYKESRVRLSRY